MRKWKRWPSWISSFLVEGETAKSYRKAEAECLEQKLCPGAENLIPDPSTPISTVTYRPDLTYRPN